jgi:hypothetical protein
MISHLVQVRGNNGSCNLRYSDANALTMSSNLDVSGNLLITGSLNAGTMVINNGFSSTPASSYAYFNMGATGAQTGVANTSPLLTSVSAQYAIQAPQFIALSDARVKTKITETDADALAKAVQQLPVKTWAYKDTVQHGEGVRLGFIAQDILPTALSPFTIAKHADFTPDIFQHATLVQGKCTYSLPRHGLIKGDKIRYCTLTTTGTAIVLDVISEDIFTVDKEIEPTLFVYGKFASDIMSIDYDAIVAALVASHQSLEKRLASLENK